MSENTAESPDPVPSALLELLAVFEGPLAEVQFPGVDAGVLRAHVDQVRAHAQELDVLRAQLDALHGHLAEARARLQRTAEQGLAYARVYAADDPELEARLGEISLAGSGKAGESRRRKLPGASVPELVVAAAGSGNGELPGAEPLRLPPRRGRKPRDLEASTGS